ncbi:protein kinase [Nocardia sp. NPDC058640]|uniref:protein kinase domain-containing protein n=1 Tax=Nocardia sp. NPDC058640 TaxID=3346571 RepID=UPI00364C7735
MARLHVLGDWHGPGEEKSAHYLAENLPNDWDVIAGRQVPAGNSKVVDADLIIVGQRRIFVCEEKSWGPRVDAGEVTWYVNGQQRGNPVDQVSHTCRVVAGRLIDRVGGWKAHVNSMRRGTHLVVAQVVMSNPRLDLSGTADFGADTILSLTQTPEVLLRRDAEVGSGLGAMRDKVMSYLLGLRERDPAQMPTQIMQYKVLDLLRIEDDVPVYAALNPAEQVIFLTCVPIANSERPADAQRLAVREHDALALLATENRTWQVRDWFDWEGYRVTPVLPDLSGTSLHKAIYDDTVETDSHERIPAAIATATVRDAFAALAAVHSHDIAHRALRPKSIEVTSTGTVRFRDFGRARIASSHTVAASLTDDHPSTPFRAPNATMPFFGPKDDVYSLALSLIQWIHGNASETPDHDQARTQAAAYPEIGATLARCLALSPKDRPDAAEVVALLTEPTPPAPEVVDAVAPSVGGLVAGRYRLVEQLGEGSQASTWLAADEQVPGKRTLKYLRHDRVSPEEALAEFENTDRLRSHYCARVYDFLRQPDPGVIVQEYVPGRTLKELAENSSLDGAAYRRIARDVVSGLHEAHQQGLFHRDVSPTNIIVGADGNARLIDFGLATSPDNARSAVGSPPFTAPEVWAHGIWSAAADLYSAAVSLLTVMLGRYPYRSVDLSGRTTLIAPTEAHLTRFGRDLLDALYAAVAADPAQRPQSATEFLGTLTENIELTPQSNPTVAALRGLYRHSGLGNAGNRGLDDEFAHYTYAPTWLDTKLLPAILDRRLDVVVLSGNPGDGKTSFLVKVGAALDDRGAKTIQGGYAGWRKTLDGHEFVAVYDASESNDGQSSDDMLHAALGDIETNSNTTVLIAANDGRVTQYFTDNEDLYPDTAEQLLAQRDREPAPDARVILVDLKRRALATPKGVGLAGHILELFTEPDRWSVCVTCTARESCPMRSNAIALRAPATVTAVTELVLTSHLRRRRRATVRDVRSAFAWLITGDLSCEQVHTALDREQDPLVDANMLPHLTFGGGSPDYLLQEWGELDPGELATPGAVRSARTRADLVPDPHQVTAAQTKRLKRALFLGMWGTASDRLETRGYRYIDDYLAALTDTANSLPRFISGLSRVLGYVGYADGDLALRDQAYSSDAVRAIVVIKELSISEFSLAVEGNGSDYLESFRDQLILRHSSGVALRINLDTAELLLRAADGEILGDLASEAIRQEIVGFGNRLRREPAAAVRVIDGSGRSLRAVATDGRIVREEI